LTGLAEFALGDNPTAGTLRDVARAEGVEPIAAVRALRW
jgi:hypothetical protein